MPTIRERLNFNFDGIWSGDFGLIQISTDSGMYDEAMGASRSIVETKMNGNDKPLFSRIEESPLSFDMTIAFTDKFTDDDIDGIIRWLFVDYYKPLYFEGKEDRIYYCLPEGEPKIVHNGLQQGYFTISMRCDSARIYSPYVITNNETITGTKTITVTNDGHTDIYPEISIRKVGAGTITIESLDDFGQIFQIKDLTNGEDIYLNSEKEIIQTDIVGVWRYDKIIGEFPRLVYGQNRFKITGDCVIQFRYKNKYKF